MAKAIAQQQIQHYPRLDTVLMIEDAIKKVGEYPSRTQLGRHLPRQVMGRTLNLVLDYLEGSGKILIDTDGKIVWVFADSPKLKKLLNESVRVH